MHLLVGDTVGTRVHTAAKNGVIQEIVDADSNPDRIIDAIFIRVLARRPTKEELESMLELVEENNSSSIYQDIFAGLISSSEFLFNH
jgi:hypothetical protein